MNSPTIIAPSNSSEAFRPRIFPETASSAAQSEIEDLLKPCLQKNNAPTPDMLLRLIFLGVLLAQQSVNKSSFGLHFLENIFIDLHLIKSEDRNNTIPEWYASLGTDEVRELLKKVKENLISILYHGASEEIQEEKNILLKDTEWSELTVKKLNDIGEKSMDAIENRFTITVQKMYSIKNANLSYWYLPLLLFYFIVDKIKLSLRKLILFMLGVSEGDAISISFTSGFLGTEKQRLDECYKLIQYEMTQCIFPNSIISLIRKF